MKIKMYNICTIRQTIFCLVLQSLDRKTLQKFSTTQSILTCFLMRFILIPLLLADYVAAWRVLYAVKMSVLTPLFFRTVFIQRLSVWDVTALCAFFQDINSLFSRRLNSSVLIKYCFIALTTQMEESSPKIDRINDGCFFLCFNWF